MWASEPGSLFSIQIQGQLLSQNPRGWAQQPAFSRPSGDGGLLRFEKHCFSVISTLASPALQTHCGPSQDSYPCPWAPLAIEPVVPLPIRRTDQSHLHMGRGL